MDWTTSTSNFFRSAVDAAKHLLAHPAAEPLLGAEAASAEAGLETVAGAAEALQTVEAVELAEVVGMGLCGEVLLLAVPLLFAVHQLSKYGGQEQATRHVHSNDDFPVSPSGGTDEIRGHFDAQGRFMPDGAETGSQHTVAAAGTTVGRLKEQLDRARKELNDLERRIIEETGEPAVWNNPVLHEKRRQIDELRGRIDYFNSVDEPEPSPSPKDAPKRDKPTQDLDRIGDPLGNPPPANDVSEPTPDALDPPLSPTGTDDDNGDYVW